MKQHVRADAGAGVDQDDVGLLLQFGQRVDEPLAVEIASGRPSRQARRPADQAESAGRVDHHFAQLLLARDDVREVERQIDVAEHVGVGQAQIGVEQDDMLARPTANWIARLTAMLLLPTPPLPLVTAITLAPATLRAASPALRSCVA